MEMTVELFDNIINTSQDCVFWKDKDRRFLGVNQAFLDFTVLSLQMFCWEKRTRIWGGTQIRNRSSRMN